MGIDWSEWVKVSNWLDLGKNADPKIPDDYGVYMMRVAPTCLVRGGSVLYLGSTYSNKKVKKGPDHFTGLRKRIGIFVSSAMGFATGHSAGREFYDVFIKNDPTLEYLDLSGRDLRPTARDIEVRWSVVDCPRCTEREAYLQMTPQPIFNRETPKECGREGCSQMKAGTEYPWDEWFSGDLLVLEKSCDGEKKDFEVDVKRMMKRIEEAARSRYKFVEISCVDTDRNKLVDSLIIRARDMTTNERVDEDRKRAGQ